MNRRRLATLTAVSAASLALAGWATLSHTRAAPTAAEAPLPVQAAPVRFVGEESAGDSLADGASYAATLHHDREAQLAFRLAGRIAAYPARIGMALPRGGLVAALEAAPWAAAATRASAERDRTRRAATRYGALAAEGAAAGAQAEDGADAARAARAAAEAAAYDLASTRLVMPFAGTVIARRGETGEVAAAGQALVTVADTASPLVATAQVPVAAAAALRPGQAASATLPDGRRLTGRVLRKAAGADPASGLVAIDVILPRSAGAVSGTPAAIRFGAARSTATAATGGLVPAEAVLEAQGDRAGVYVIDAQGRARRRAVRLIGFEDRDARIAGLKPGARVITKGAGFVADGQRVEVVP